MGSSRAGKAKAKRSRSRAKSPARQGQHLQALRDWFLPDGAIFAGLRLHGNSKWTPLGLVWLALCWAWCDSRYVTDAFTEACAVSRSMFGTPPVSTYQGFMAALVT